MPAPPGSNAKSVLLGWEIEGAPRGLLRTPWLTAAVHARGWARTLRRPHPTPPPLPAPFPCPAVVADKGLLAAREATPEPAGPAGRSPSPAPPGAAALSPTAAAAASGSLLAEQLSGRLETVGEEGGGEGGGFPANDASGGELAGGDEEYDPETAFADQPPKPAAAPAAASTPTAAALDWASIKAAAAAAGQQGGGAGGARLAPLKFEPLATVDAQPEGREAGAEGPREHKPHHHHHKREHPSASPHEASV